MGEPETIGKKERELFYLSAKATYGRIVALAACREISWLRIAGPRCIPQRALV